MPKANKFIFESYALDRATSTIHFSYSVELETGESLAFNEILTFPVNAQAWEGLTPEVLEACLQSLLLVLGLSYWKMHCAPMIEIRNFSLDAQQAEFWNTIYTKGLGEFFYRNQLDFRGLVKFPSGNLSSQASPGVHRDETRDPSRCLVPLGGGKDSLVTIELLREHGIDFDLFTLGTSLIQKQTAVVVGKNPLVIQRKLDEKMIELSRGAEVFNGHIPITAVYHFAGVLLAALQGCGYVVFSNEQSSNQGNVEYLGQNINHQWSKSGEFESLVRDYVRTYITPKVIPFSLLRPLSEMRIVERFVRYPKYFQTFSSCNRNFVIASTRPKTDRGAYWCGACPKCAFVFAMLSAFLDKKTVVEIFGKDLYADAALLPLFKSLLGKEGFKPFECVGTPEETTVAMHKASARGDFAGTAVMNYFNQETELTVQDFSGLEQRVLEAHDTSSLPEEFRHIYEG